MAQPKVDNAREDIQCMRRELQMLKLEVDCGITNQARLSKVRREFDALAKDLGLD